MTTLFAIYTPRDRGRTLRLAGLRLAEAGTFAVAVGLGAACYAAQRAGLSRTAGRLAVLVDYSTDVSDQVSARINELGSVDPHPALMSLYRWVGGEALDVRLAAMFGNEGPQHPGPTLTADQPTEAERSVYADPVAAVTGAEAGEVTDEQLDRAEAELFARFDKLLGDAAGGAHDA